MRSRGARAIGFALLAFPAALAAQRPMQRALPEPAPSRADSLLARGRLWAAEEALYKAVDAAPRAPAARGELGRYLASRARFTIAEVLFREALRFGADTPSVAQALVAIAPYRPEVDRRRIPGVRLPAAESAREEARLAARANGAWASIVPGAATNTDASAGASANEAIVPFAFAREGAIGMFEVRGPGGVRRAVLDSRVSGVLVPRADDAALQPRAHGATAQGAPLLIPELWIGAMRLRGVEARVNTEVPDGEVRIGFDVLWALQPVFDEVRGTMTLYAIGAARRTGPNVIQIPFALAFPGMWLIPVVGEPPIALSTSRARALLWSSRWWWDGSQATLVVER